MFHSKGKPFELISDLSTEGFILALRRFVGRRGKPSNEYLDNSTNFLDANSELAKFLQ